MSRGSRHGKKVTNKGARYTIINGILYKRGYSVPLLRCLNEKEALTAKEEVHGRICGNHAGGQSLVHKIMRQGYFWPTMKKDALEFTRKFDKCQRFTPSINPTPKELHYIMAPWPFAKWGGRSNWSYANWKRRH